MKEKNNSHHHARDRMFYTIFSDKELFRYFLRDFVKEPWTANLTVNDLQDVTTKFVNLRQGDRESDVIYKLNLTDGVAEREIFIFVLLEHQSKVNYLMPFRILEYMVRIWRKYINEHKPSVRQSKEFKLPVIYPIVFYDGIYQWTAEKSFDKKVEKYDLLKKYIPKFEYKLISLKNIKETELADMDNPLSLIMLIDKIKDIKELANLQQLKTEYWQRAKEYFKDSKILEIVAESITLMLASINIPDEEIAKIKEQFYEGRLENMFELAVKYDVQKVRAEGRQEGIKEGRLEGKLETKIEMVKAMLLNGFEVDMIAKITGLDGKTIDSLKEALIQ